MPAGTLFARQRRAPSSAEEVVTAFRDGQVTARANRRTEGFTNAIQEIGYQGVRRGDLVIHSMDGFAGAIGVSDSDGKASPVVHAYSPVEGVDARFFAYMLRTLARMGFVTSLAKGIRERSTAFDSETFRSLALPVPTAAVQRAIADHLDRETARIDALIAANGRMVELSEERRTLALLERVAPRLLSNGHVPAHWSTARIKYLFRPPVAGTWGSEPDGSPQDILCIRVADFDRRRYRIDERAATLRSVEQTARSKCLLRPGDILIEKSGGGESQPVGFTVVFDLDVEAICSNFVARLRPRPEIDPVYAGLMMAAAYRAGHNVPFIKQTTGIQNLDLSAYLSLPWYIPDRASQVKICKHLRSVFSTIDQINETLDRQVVLLRERRDALITAAVTGQLDIPETV